MKVEGREIALFCKFWFAGEPVWFANVCNVRGFPKLFRRAEAGGQNKIFIEAVILKFGLVIFFNISLFFLFSTLQVTSL